MTKSTHDAPGPRAKAIAAGEPKYFTGKPCRNGHTAERYTMDGYCVTCRSESQRAERAEIMRRRQP